MDDFDLESLVNVEQTFYDAGFQDGFDHGRIHGLIEGRALGREKGFEMWEELGFYEGTAKGWRGLVRLLERDEVKTQRTLQRIEQLLDLISQFPLVNPSKTQAAGEGQELDIPKLQRQIRSRYKALCASLNIRPRLQVVSEGALPDDPDADVDVDAGGVDEESEGGQGVRQTVAPGSSIPVWKVDKTGARKAVTNQDLSY